MPVQISHEYTAAAPLEAVAQALVAECSQTDDTVSRPTTQRVEYRNGARRGRFVLRQVTAASTSVTWSEQVPLPRFLQRPLTTASRSAGTAYFRRIEVMARALADAAAVADLAPADRRTPGDLPPPTPGRTIMGRG